MVTLQGGKGAYKGYAMYLGRQPAGVGAPAEQSLLPKCLWLILGSVGSLGLRRRFYSSHFSANAS